GTRPTLAGVGLRAGVAVVAARAVLLRGVAADAVRGVADARVVALIERTAHDRIAAGAAPALARVGLRARVAVVARRAVRLVRIAADPGRRIARARHVALIERAAGDRIRPLAGAPLAGVGLGARIAVVARGAVRLRLR